jgi:mannose-6-phosphate isomerase-like protein (cupin superfamily)
MKQLETKVRKDEDTTWSLMPGHPGLYHKEIMNAADADAMNVMMSSILWERIDVGGAVLPHYHDVAEVICITVGKVRLLCNGIWQSYQAGDTFLVPAGVIHSVVNDDTEPTEQISLFIPLHGEETSNRFFGTTKVDIPLEKGSEKYA